ncbi:MAG: hypothetical protein P4M08_02005 [Oligoflexia bacterium]|nr:hypothetical protein [Oligoflexia bacterium]
MKSVKKSVKYLVLMLAVFGASACEKEIQIIDGKIPAQYLPEAQAVMGSYSGIFDDNSNVLTAQLSGNYVSLTAQQDLLDPRCQSHIGSLKTVGVTKDGQQNPHITSAAFDFDPNDCVSFSGRSLELFFQSNGVVHARLLQTYEPVPQCSAAGGYPGGVPIQNCWTDYVPVYLTGTFSKIQ